MVIMKPDPFLGVTWSLRSSYSAGQLNLAHFSTHVNKRYMNGVVYKIRPKRPILNFERNRGTLTAPSRRTSSPDRLGLSMCD